MPAQGHRFSLKCVDEQGVTRGACIVGRPVARMLDQRKVVEVTRLVTDGTPNACSVLYAAAARSAELSGTTESSRTPSRLSLGASLRAVGWTDEGLAGGGDWNVPSRGGRRRDQPMELKRRWGRVLK